MSGDRRHDDAGEARVHVQQQLLQVQEVPRRLRRVRRDVGVRAVEQRRVDERRQDDERDREQDGADELDEDEVRPDQELFVALALWRTACEAPAAGAATAMRCCLRLQRPRQAAVAADAPEVDGHEDRGEQRQADDVQRVEADERVRADLEAADAARSATRSPRTGAEPTMFVPTVIAQSASWSQGSR